MLLIIIDQKRRPDMLSHNGPKVLLAAIQLLKCSLHQILDSMLILSLFLYIAFLAVSLALSMTCQYIRYQLSHLFLEWCPLLHPEVLS